MIAEILHFWEAAKDMVLPHDQSMRAIWHLHAGLAAYLGLTVLLGRPLYSRLPISLVWVLELTNELMDLQAHWPVRHDWVWRDTLGDVVNTLLWPTLLFLHAAWGFDRRFRPAGRPQETAFDEDVGAETASSADKDS